MIWLKRIAIFIISIIAIPVIATYLFWTPTPQESNYQLVKTWGTKGRQTGQFNEPTGIAIYKNEIFVSDSRNSRIQVFDVDGNFKRLVDTEGKGQLKRPMNLSTANNELYVADFFSDQIKIYDLNGKFKRAIGKSGSNEGEFSAPGGVTVNSAGELFVADFFNQRIQQLKADGEFIQQWGQTGTVGMLDGKLNYPTDVAINKENILYIADGYNDRILAYDQNGLLLYKWGGPFAMNIFGPFNGWFATVTGLAIGPKGNIFVADFYNDRVQKFTSDGDFLNAFGLKTTNATHTAIAVAIANDGSVFVADYANHQIQKWQLKK